MTSPITEKESEYHKFECGEVGASAMQGWRKEMEVSINIVTSYFLLAENVSL